MCAFNPKDLIKAWVIATTDGLHKRKLQVLPTRVKEREALKFTLLVSSRAKIEARSSPSQPDAITILPLGTVF